ncbi:ABC transporter ATP-binding protein [Wenxinia marina]|uniref:ABC-type cobalamin/Fe3+-siderophores transport system, ATPase component n=1 Tax=Wenxinia marina DSM 24838 TaxID=1123501 RepID=A0A0D0Q411_9RHOB|nr:ABC transporter ATP-binding protein [Wenxinia marina]KIQ69234.1 ABC-type cobalamin/Fe3+-siderophores transport system, ATPase component [Wenxinia marina DSM 24838]GGL71342.1 iron-enterobactin transporter ATP-binding protein [Wenxinia marina]
MIPSPPSRSPALSARSLSVGYGGLPVLARVDLDIARGEMTALVGPNGCGKSTLLKALARVLRPSAGGVLLDDAPIAQLPTRTVARRLALLPQGPVAPEGLTVEELVRQGRFPHRTLLRPWSREDAAAVARALAQTGLQGLAGRPVATLSGGQRQRAWIAMVLAQDTPLVLLDEPTTFLDLKVQVDLMALLSRIVREDGRTMVLVLHELNLASAFADRIVMMRDGRIVRDGTPRAVMQPGILREVFGLEADVITDPATGRPVCLPRPGAVRTQAAA